MIKRTASAPAENGPFFTVRRLREGGTKAATVDHSSHNVSMDFLFLLWAVSYVGIRRVSYQTIGDTLSDK